MKRRVVVLILLVASVWALFGATLVSAREPDDTWFGTNSQPSGTTSHTIWSGSVVNYEQLEARFTLDVAAGAVASMRWTCDGGVTSDTTTRSRAGLGDGSGTVAVTIYTSVGSPPINLTYCAFHVWSENGGYFRVRDATIAAWLRPNSGEGTIPGATPSPTPSSSPSPSPGPVHWECQTALDMAEVSPRFCSDNYGFTVPIGGSVTVEWSVAPAGHPDANSPGRYERMGICDTTPAPSHVCGGTYLAIRGTSATGGDLQNLGLHDGTNQVGTYNFTTDVNWQSLAGTERTWRMVCGQGDYYYATLCTAVPTVRDALGGIVGPNGLPIDSDGDGVSDEDEIAAGYDPNDPNSFPGGPSPSPSGGAPTPDPSGAPFPTFGAPDPNNPGNGGNGVPGNGGGNLGGGATGCVPTYPKVGMINPTVVQSCDFPAFDGDIFGFIGNLLNSILCRIVNLAVIFGNAVGWVWNRLVDFIVPSDCLPGLVAARLTELGAQPPMSWFTEVTDLVDNATVGSASLGAIPLPGGGSVGLPFDMLASAAPTVRPILVAVVWLMTALGIASFVSGSFGVKSAD